MLCVKAVGNGGGGESVPSVNFGQNICKTKTVSGLDYFLNFLDFGHLKKLCEENWLSIDLI